MSVVDVKDIDLFNVIDHPMSGWIASLMTTTTPYIRWLLGCPVEERLLLLFENHPLIVSYACCDIGLPFATTFLLPVPKHALYAMSSAFTGTPMVSRPRWWGHSDQEYPSSPIRAWRTTNSQIAISPKLKPHPPMRCLTYCFTS